MADQPQVPGHFSVHGPVPVVCDPWLCGFLPGCGPLNPAVDFPLLPGTPGAFITVYLGFVLLLSDAPFRSRQQQFVLQRVGKRIWAAGQLLYLFLACLVFTLLLWVLTWIFLLPRLEWGMGLGPGPHYGSRLRYFTRVWGVGLEYECMRNVAPWRLRPGCLA